MGQGRLHTLICLHTLLIATAIQGITPDAQDLASLKPLWMLSRMLAAPDAMSGDDGLPDEVCATLPAEIEVVAHHPAEPTDSANLERFATERLSRTRRAGAPGSPPAWRNVGGSGGLIFTLCRLVC
jgi:hypothetical protein